MNTNLKLKLLIFPSKEKKSSENIGIKQTDSIINHDTE